MQKHATLLEKGKNLFIIKKYYVKEILSPLLPEVREGRPSAQFKACVHPYHEGTGHMNETFYILKAHILYFILILVCVCSLELIFSIRYILSHTHAMLKGG